MGDDIETEAAGLRGGPAGRAARELRVVVSRLRRRLREFWDAQDLWPSQTSVFSRLRTDGTDDSASAGAERVGPASVAATLAAPTLLDRLCRP